MGWAALMVGIALGLRQLVQQGLGIFGGAIADRFRRETDDRHRYADACRRFRGDGRRP
ncbi:multidrug resistance protein MdtH [Klebsiella pneumoniae]|uniref:Multidrug resistance protein MdtH n=1 Tax=Klebsiella pneumoniae TaxID=573 RepID=A0A2X1Q8K0_KLEPN|nr:multidrug resistance protein MdtH [Klebsiella pneumoniae]